MTLINGHTGNPVLGEGGRGYSGTGTGLNNPDMQNQRDIGPLPQGYYTIGTPYNSTRLGDSVLPLTPDTDNEMYGRDNFLIHADNNAHNNTASTGCIILRQEYREQIAESGVNRLHVVSGEIPR